MTSPAPNPVVVDPDDAMLCGVCGHALEAHDPIAQRYCQATAVNALSRKCVCPVAGE